MNRFFFTVIILTMKYYILFPSSTEAMKADAKLASSGVSYEIVPVPKAISSECGICVRSEADLDVLLKILEGVRINAVYDERFRLLLSR